MNFRHPSKGWEFSRIQLGEWSGLYYFCVCFLQDCGWIPTERYNYNDGLSTQFVIPQESSLQSVIFNKRTKVRSY
ncbi:hypothetical protein EU348_16245 [Chryseobacterium indologenes]|uniref:Uncharacterized protein n=1 Tax=Chryseobacterium indologenes TaxID=253 RepID=A0A411DQN5_CHRID|nr:hypothetical protein EU348_16245 [Chryseobacterium indologenes]